MEDAIHWREEQQQNTKYRASCDACNEAKVRCSRTKPTCARCQKSRVVCIYGLSRRSHRTAARIGCSIPRQQQQQQQQQEKEDRQPLNSLSSSDITLPIEGIQLSSSSTQSDYATPNLSVDFSDINFDLSMITSPTSANSLMNSALQDLSKDSELGLNASHLPELALDFSFSSTGVDLGFSNSDPGSWGMPRGDSATRGYTTESCSSRIVTRLASTTLLLNARRISLDVHLSQLKDATNFAEECLGAVSSDWDELSPLALSLLIGSIIVGFERSLEEIESARDSQASSPPQTIGAEVVVQPQFSWGALQIDNKDELVLFKRHMWLMQFQRLDGVLQNLRSRVKNMDHEQMDQATAQKILALNHVRLWLEQQVQLVRQRFSLALNSP